MNKKLMLFAAMTAISAGSVLAMEENNNSEPSTPEILKNNSLYESATPNTKSLLKLMTNTKKLNFEETNDDIDFGGSFSSESTSSSKTNTPVNTPTGTPQGTPVTSPVKSPKKTSSPDTNLARRFAYSFQKTMYKQIKKKKNQQNPINEKTARDFISSDKFGRETINKIRKKNN